MSIKENDFRTMLDSLEYFLEVSTHEHQDDEHGIRGKRPQGILLLREIYYDLRMPERLSEWGQESGNTNIADTLVNSLDDLAVADTMFNTAMSEWLYSIDDYPYKTLNESLWFDLNNKLRPLVVRLKLQLERAWGVFLKSQLTGDDRWLKFTSLAGIAIWVKSKKLSCGKSTVNDWLNRREPWIKKRGEIYLLDSGHAKFNPPKTK